MSSVKIPAGAPKRSGVVYSDVAPKAKAKRDKGDTQVWKKFAGAVQYSVVRTETGMTMTLPFPPSANYYWRKNRDGKVYVSPDAIAYRAEVAALFELRGRRICEPMTGAVAVTYTVYFPADRGDLGNRFKVLDDALNKWAWADDEDIVETHAYRRVDRQRARVEVVISALETLGMEI